MFDLQLYLTEKAFSRDTVEMENKRDRELLFLSVCSKCSGQMTVDRGQGRLPRKCTFTTTTLQSVDSNLTRH